MNHRIDSHQHFWKFNSVVHAWIDDSMHKIQRDFLPKDLEPLLQDNKFTGCIAVQADQTEKETEFLIGLAKEHDFIKGVVGWADLLDEKVGERLEYFSDEKKLKGFRHVVQGEPDGFMLRKDFRRGVAALKQFGYTYDILVFHHQLPDAIKLAALFPDQPFVLDHVAKPDLRTGNINIWKANMKELAKAENVLCKVSGMVTEAHWDRWTTDDLKPCLDAVFENFTPNRLLFGSDWPVCTVAAGYAKVVTTLQDYMAQLSHIEQDQVWFKNAQAFYNLDI